MKPNKKTYIYTGFMLLLSLFIVGYLVFNFRSLDIKMLLFWSLLTVLVESLLIALPNNNIGISVGSAVNLAAIIVGGPLLAVISAAMGILLRVPKVAGRGFMHLFNTPVIMTIFNVSQSIVVTGIIGLIYTHTGGIVGKFHIMGTILILLIGTILNTIIISFLMATMIEDNFIRIWISSIKDIIPSIVAVGTIGIIMALAFISYSYGAVLLFLGPLLLARYSYKLYMDMRHVSLSVIESLSKALDAKDSYTSGHVSRVEEYCVKLAESLDFSAKETENVRLASRLHDIGKIGISDDILNKDGKLTENEYEKIMKHPHVGADIIGEISFLKEVSKIIRHHHERYDGSGYPEGLRGDEVPIESYMLSIADSYDAMTSNRPYRDALSKDEAIEEIKENSGTQFHPKVVKKFIYMIEN